MILSKQWLMDRLGEFENFRNIMALQSNNATDDEVIEIISKNYNQRQLAELVFAMDFVMMNKYIDEQERIEEQQKTNCLNMYM